MTFVSQSFTQRLIMGEDHCVVLGVSFVTSLVDPSCVGGEFGMVSSNVVSVHVERGPTFDDPLGQLSAASTSEHHA